MGTHADIYFLDQDGKPLVRIFSHYDGYPAARGQDLYDLLSGRWEYDCCPIDRDDLWKYFSNGMGDLAALAVWHLKRRDLSYNICLERIYPDWKERMERIEYTYVVKPCLRDGAFDILNIDAYFFGTLVYEGDIEGFARRFSLNGNETLANDRDYGTDRGKRR